MYITDGWINGEGDLLSADRSVIMLKLSGLELNIKSGDTHRMIWKNDSIVNFQFHEKNNVNFQFHEKNNVNFQFHEKK